MPETLKKLIHTISLLPGIGDKSAAKLAFFLLNASPNYVESFAESLGELRTKIGHCETCHSLVDLGEKECSICRNPHRDEQTIAVVEEYLDLLTFEQSGAFQGKYHVLWGAISPVNGVFVADLNFKTLFERVEKISGNVELILATNPNIEGEATAMYIKEEIEKRGLKNKVKMTRLSRGLSSGYIEYADNMTLISAFKDRKEM